MSHFKRSRESVTTSATSTFADAHVFSADRPIDSSRDDVLGRSKFAQSIAVAIGNWRHRDSLVLAIRGPWGSGKTSVNAMVLESLRDQSNSTTVLEFSPWEWAGQDQLVEGFFHELGVVIGRADKSKAGKKRAALWRKYAAQLNVAALGVSGIRSILFSSLLLVGALGLSSIFGHTTVKVVGGVISVVCLVLIGLLRFSQKFANGLSEMFIAKTEAQSKTLSDVKRELSDGLRQMANPIVVVLDDVDRLTPDEVRVMLQLVKANADLPQLVYVMLFERAVVESALDEYTTGRGRAFLDKIVQVSFDLPNLEQSRLDKVLFEKLNELLSRGEAARRFDSARWANLWVGSLQSFFRTLRDVNRFIGTLSFHLALLTTDETLEVNPVDLIALEALRHFEPEVYAILPKFKNLLTSVTSLSPGAQLDQMRQTMAETLVDAASNERREKTRELLAQLFPPVESSFGGPHNYGSDFSEGWRRELRVCSEALFDRYFLLALPEMDISQGVLARILSVTGDRDALTDEFRAVHDAGLFDVLLERLESYKQEISITDAIPFLTALFDVGEDVGEVSAGMFDMSPMIHAVRIVLWYLKQEPNEEERQSILLESLAATSGLNIPLRFIAFITPSDNAGRQDEPLLREDLLAPLQLKCVELIKAAAIDGRLASHENLASLLATWREWGDSDEVRAWVNEVASSDSGFIGIVRQFVTPVRIGAMGSHVATTRWSFILSAIETYINVEELRVRLTTMGDAALEPDDKRAIDTLRKAIDRRDQGFADSAFDWND